MNLFFTGRCGSVILLAVIVVFATISQVQAQSSFGGYNNKIHWSQINTEQVRVIFPDSLVNRAQRVANIVHYMNDNNVGLLGKKRKKVDIILRNNDVISNGYAQVAPLKSEFFMQAPQKTFEESSVDWTDQLALHEYRHVNQFVNARQGIGKLVYWIFGDYGWGGVIGVTAPAWFLEGDATLNETALSSGGRGRVPSFSAFLRAQQEEGIKYSYMKALNGSYKDFVPNHYNTGYLILSEVRREHSNADFDEITRQTANFKGIIYPFRKAVKRVTGISIKSHYLNAADKLKASIPDQSQSTNAITEEEKNNVVQYDNPILEDGELYFSYGNRSDIRGIYKFSGDGEHERITYRGIIADTYFDKHDNLYVWSEIQRDIRRGNQNFSNIVLYDQETKKKRLIGRGEAYFSPSFTSDAKNLVFVNGYKGIDSGISMLNIDSNARLDIIKSRTKQFLYPISSASGKSVYAIVKEGHKYAIAEIGMDASFTLITDWDEVVFGPMKLSEGHLIFQANYGPTDQVYALDVRTKKLKKISNDAIGMYNPSNYEDGKLIAVRPHSRGFLLHEVETDLGSAQAYRTGSNIDLPYYLKTEHLEPNDILDKVPAKDFEVSKYPRNTKIINPHSWLLSTDLNFAEYSATVFSDNILNNVSIQPTYRYNRNVRGSFLDLDLNYGRYFPIYQLSYSASLPREVKSSDGERTFDVSQQSIRPGFIIPLNLTKGTYQTVLRFFNSVTQTWSLITEQQTQQSFNQQGTTINNTISFVRRRFTAGQNLYPRWGVGLQVLNRYRVNDGHNGLNVASEFYVPGFSRNHGFRFDIDYAQQNGYDESRTEHVDIFNYAYGFRSVNYDKIWSFNTNYAMPLTYPDWGFADFIYIKRVRSVMFHNYNLADRGGVSEEFQSVGADLLLDIVFNNTVFSEISVGIRNAYMFGALPEGKRYPYHYALLFSIPAF